MTPCSVRAIWSAPPPVPAGTINSTVFVGFHCAEADTVSASTAAAATAPQDAIRDSSFFIAFSLSHDRFPLFFASHAERISSKRRPAERRQLGGVYWLPQRRQPLRHF